jgi:hypothetical protein
MTDKGDDYVGHKHPPVHARFRKGQSGNPNGRPRGARGLRAELRKQLSARHTTETPMGRKFRGTRQSVALEMLAERAARGDLKAMALLVPLIIQAFGFEDPGSGKGELSAQDKARLEAYLRDMDKGVGDGPEKPDKPEGTDAG